jgi:hypothetical protein
MSRRGGPRGGPPLPEGANVAYALPARVKPGWPLAALTLAMGLIFCTLTNVTTAAVLDAAGARVQASASGDRV